MDEHARTVQMARNAVSASFRHRTTLGFDIRLPRGRYLEREWPAPRRERYLLRPEIAWPWSVDRTVWPSPFRFPGEWIDPDRKERCVEPRLGFAELAVRMWRDRAGLKSALAEHFPGQERVGIPLRVDLITDAPVGSYEAWSILDVLPAPAVEHGESWRLIGYDVADGSLLSGLMNCGYTRPELESLRPGWAPRLNAHGLFATLDDAVTFRAITDGRVPEHAPFFVFALSSLDEAGKLG